MKTSGSPCPPDQICKRCPYLWMVITEIIAVAWKSCRIPSAWKRACTILVHKKGNHDDPANFRPIILQSVPLTIVTSCLRDTIYSFLKQNGFVKQRIQKVCTHGISSVLEYKSMMGHVITKAYLKQSSVDITLLDLKNAFEEVHYNLINSVLTYYHIPQTAQLLIANLYTGFHSSIISDCFTTPAIPFQRGVLQGDCLSPLLFNLCFNTFVQFIKQEKHTHLGFSPRSASDCLLHPIQWCQFAGEATVVTSDEGENQLLLNCFIRWCQWAYMQIRIDKCITLRIKKFST